MKRIIVLLVVVVAFVLGYFLITASPNGFDPSSCNSTDISQEDYIAVIKVGGISNRHWRIFYYSQLDDMVRVRSTITDNPDEAIEQLNIIRFDLIDKQYNCAKDTIQNWVD